jgi:hypothetical protein
MANDSTDAPRRYDIVTTGAVLDASGSVRGRGMFDPKLIVVVRQDGAPPERINIALYGEDVLDHASLRLDPIEAKALANALLEITRHIP